MSKNGDIIIKDEDPECSKDYDREANLKKIIEKATFIMYVVEKDDEMENKELKDAKRNHLMFLFSLLILISGFLPGASLVIVTKEASILAWFLFGVAIVGCFMLVYTTYVYSKNHKIWGPALTKFRDGG